jgi:hypothetical protein
VACVRILIGLWWFRPFTGPPLQISPYLVSSSSTSSSVTFSVYVLGGCSLFVGSTLLLIKSALQEGVCVVDDEGKSSGVVSWSY